MGYSPWGRKESDMTERLFKKELRSHTSQCGQNPSVPSKKLQTQEGGGS